MTVRLKILTAFSLLLMAVTLLSAPLARAGGDVGPVASPVPVANKFTGWWELGGYYGTDDSSRGEIVLFTPLAQSATTIFFLDARGKFFEEDVQEGNLALGYRKMMPSGWNIGVWGGWDIRDTTNDNTFNQISFGFEALSERYDVRVNGYVPLEDSKGVSDTNSFEALLQGNNILVQGTNTDIDELALYGVDAEFGILLFGGNRGSGGYKGAAPAGRHELRAYAGGFWFDNDDADDAIAGPKGRLEYRINDVIGSLPGSRLTIESELSYDEVRDTKFEIGARLRIPFGAFGRGGPLQTAHLSAQELRMTEGLERDTDIVTNEETEVTVTTEGAIDDATDVALDNVSFAKTADQFAKAVNDGGNRLIILQKGNKRIDVSATDGQQLQDNQTVQGGASTILIRGKKTGEVVPFTAPGSRPTVFTNDTNFDTGAITVANNTHVAGVNIRGVGGAGAGAGGNHGIRGLDGVTNVVIEQNDIRNIGDDGMNFGDDGNKLLLENNTISNVRDRGLLFFESNRNVVLVGNKISNTGTDGVVFLDNASKVLVDGNVISNTGDRGVRFGDNHNNLVIKDNTISNTVSEGLFFGSDSQNISVHNTIVTDSGSIGVRFGFDNRNIEIKHATITGAGTFGIDFGSNNENVTIAYSEISKSGDDGINFDNNNQNITVMDTRIRNARDNGFNMGSDNDNVVLDNVQILDPDDEGINMGSRNTNVTFRNSIIDSAGLQGINMGSDNRLKIINSTISDTGNNALNIGGNDNTITITDSTISDTGGNALNVFGGNTTLDINGTTFAGNIGQDILDFDDVGNVVNGANNPNSANVGGFVCDLNAGSGDFTGSITIGNQTFVNGAGCNP